jgi:hypothetical protein
LVAGGDRWDNRVTLIHTGLFTLVVHRISESRSAIRRTLPLCAAFGFEKNADAWLQITIADQSYDKYIRSDVADSRLSALMSLRWR